jgi:glycosyltransferase involved in cell wall biosynthesis
LSDLLLDVLLFDVSPGEMYFASLEKYFHRPRPGLPYRTAREYGSRLAGVVVKYEAERAQAEALLGTRVSVVRNGVPVLPRAEKPRGNRLVFGTSARLSPQKKLEELFAAFRLAGASLPPYVLRVAGGPEYGSETYAEELKRNGADIPIEWLGEVDDMPTFLSTLNVFTMISEPAGCPNASLEAMAAGLPVIATDVGGAGEQVVDGVTGRLLPRGDTHAFADALKNCAENTETLARWGSAGRERIEKHFSLESMVEEYQRIFSANV